MGWRAADGKIEKVPLQHAYLALVMYDNLATHLQKSQNFPLRDSYLGPPLIRQCRVDLHRDKREQ